MKSSTAYKNKPCEGTLPGSPRSSEADSWGDINRGPRTHAKQAFGADWWETFFDLTYARLDLDSIGIEQTRREVDFLIDALNLSKDSQIADIGSGLGRHALELDRRGFERVTGLDNNRMFIEEARARAIFENLSPRFINSDARYLPFKEEFDVAYIWMNLLGYFDNPQDNTRIL
ncbi:methyltransferase domain-containing protein, partial [candidate division WOR-3 bacterium]|nr:methyltransferase domain-containing protein [candidate division WOR-3 bacterium]MBD3363959.1 methyltransferase domain-containing protein [candidate division WOR-3 bacterium]